MAADDSAPLQLVAERCISSKEAKQRLQGWNCMKRLGIGLGRSTDDDDDVDEEDEDDTVHDDSDDGWFTACKSAAALRMCSSCWAFSLVGCPLCSQVQYLQRWPLFMGPPQAGRHGCAQ